MYVAMLLPPEMLVAPGPPPQSVLDQRPWWRLLFMMLTVNSLLRIIGFDVAGALLSGVMLCFAVLMTRDGMADLSRYALVYGVLSLMNLIFDLLPLVYGLSGRSESEVTDIQADDPGSESYTVTTKSHPFFDSEQGVSYNCQSLSMILSPISMLLGAYLALYAHNEIQRSIGPPGLYGEEDPLDFTGARGFAPRETRTPPAAYGALTQAIPNSSNAQRNANTLRTQHNFQRFHGTPHKLDV